MFDLRNFREEVLKLTQKELASLIDERQDKISRLEKNPDSIGLNILVKIADTTGTTLDELVHYKKIIPDALQIVNSWESVTSIKNEIDAYVTLAIEDQENSSEQVCKVKEIRQFTDMLLKKPKVAFVGLSDTGKSTLINSLLGAEKMPAAWTPTTAITIYIKHMDDRPSYIEEDVWFFKQASEKEDIWDSNRIYDEAYTKEHFCRKGHIQDLHEFAVRDSSDEATIESAVVFIDSPILKVCDLIDLPGYNTGDRELDTILTEQVRDYADIMIYMSIANGFMRGNDIEYLKSDLNYLKVFEDNNNDRPLSNLYVIASQAHVVNKGNTMDLKKVLDQGAKRLYSQVPKELWKQRSKITGVDYTQELLRARFFTYSKDIESLRKPFELDMTTLVEGSSRRLIQQYNEALKEFCQINRLKIIADIKENLAISHKREAYIRLSENITSNLANRTTSFEKCSEDMAKRIQNLCDTSVNDLSKAYVEIVSIESLIDMIDKEGYTNVKGDLEKLGSLVNSRLQEAIHRIIESKSSEYSKDVEQFIVKHDELVNESSNQQRIDADYNYSTKTAFKKGVFECQSTGANAIWKSTHGNRVTFSNSGDGLNILSALLYSVPGTDGQTHTDMGGVAHGLALSGIIGLGIGLAMLAITSGMSAFGSGWKKNIAKKVVAAYKNENVLVTYTDLIKGFWMDTDQSFKYAVSYIEKDLYNEITKLRTKVNIYDNDRLEDSIKLDEKLIEFYKKIEQHILDGD